MAARVLLVDDDPEIVRVAEECLINHGYEVYGLSDSRQAISTFESFSPDVCLIDFRMPYLTGADLLVEFKKIDPTVEVIFLTGETDTPLAINLLKKGAIDYLMKPVDVNQLGVALSSALEHRRLVRENSAYKIRLEEMLATETEAHRLVRTLLGRYVSEEVAIEVIRNSSRHLELKGERCEVTVLFADLRGFTSIAESIDALDAVDILNACLNRAVEVVFEFGGTIDKFLGDGVMAVFGAPIRHQDHAARAARCAFLMRDQITALRFEKFPEFRMHMGFGINTGPVVAGTVGAERRMDYTVIGDVVNVAQRLESLAAPDQILIGASTYESVRNAVKVRKLGPLRVKGRTGPVIAFELLRMQTADRQFVT